MYSYAMAFDRKWMLEEQKCKHRIRKKLMKPFKNGKCKKAYLHCCYKWECQIPVKYKVDECITQTFEQVYTLMKLDCIKFNIIICMGMYTIYMI